ncbi:hypothetical protein ACE1AD_00805 [Umezakia sp. BLCC-F215]
MFFSSSLVMSERSNSILEYRFLMGWETIELVAEAG